MFAYLFYYVRIKVLVSPSAPVRRVLLLAFSFPPDNQPGAARPFRFFRYLPEFGFEPHVITASPQVQVHPRVHYVPDREAARPSGLTRIARGAWRKLVAPLDGTMLWAQGAYEAARHLHRETPFCAVLSTFPPLHAHAAALRLSRNCGLPWIADFRDPLVGNPFRHSRGLPPLFDQFFESRIFRQALLLIGVTDATVEEWRSRYPQFGSKMHVLWNGFDPDESLGPLPIPERDHKLIVHIGSFYAGRTPLPVVQSYSRLVKAGSLDPARVRLRFIGEFDTAVLDSCRSVFNDLTALGSLEYNNAVVPREQALASMASADFLFLADNNAHSTGHTVPAKLFEYLRFGRPILALTEPDSVVESLLARCGVPYVSLHPRARPAEIDAGLVRFLALPSDPARTSDWYQRTFDGRAQTQTLAGLFDSIIS